MRSIRWSLVAFFLLLVAVALGGVSLMAYQSTQTALEPMEASTRELLKAQYEENVKRKNGEFDRELQSQAQEFASHAVLHIHQVESLYVLGIIGSELRIAPDVVLLSWILESLVAPGEVRRARPLDIRFHDDDDEFLKLDRGHYHHFFSRFRGQSLHHSNNIKNPARELPADVRRFLNQNQAYVDDVEIRPGNKIQRVTIRAGIQRTREGLLVESFRPKGEPSKKGGPPFLPVYLQYANETSHREREKEVAKLQADLTRDLAQLRDEMDNGLAELRSRMLWIGFSTFVAVALGGFWLVRVGLAPLSRLTDAVSRVSEKDFRLQLGDKPLPSELQPIADHLRQRLEQLQRAFVREKQAAADISHELRTPLAALLTTLDVGLRKTRTVEEYQELLEYCRASGQQMTQLVERLLALARLDAGVDTLRPREVDVSALAEQCAALVRPLADARGLKLTVQHNGPACISGDPEKLREVLTNLLHNAIEYNRPEGVIEVAVGPDNGDLQMEVRDTGIGIAPEAKQQIFERFYRADPSRQAEGLHAGLGLSIVKGYIDLMGGSISVDSTVGQGSTFRVRLPMHPLTRGLESIRRLA